MSLSRAVLSIASIFLGLSAACAQQKQTTATAAAAPPVFQGLMVDAKGNTVGRLMPEVSRGQYYVVRQISGIWMPLQVGDRATGFVTYNNHQYVYQSSDCTGQAYLLVDPNSGSNVLALGIVATIPPATQPSIFFAGQPWSRLTFNSARSYNEPCLIATDTVYVGLPQSVLLSSLGLTLPFSVK
jgi:hypothetical protein